MARIRTVKPDTFTHESLFDSEKETALPLRLAYIGLWTQCDREGRFLWRPRQLKTDVLPYDDDIDFSRVLDALWTRGFLVKYASHGNVYGCIPSWNKHQVINNREKDSLIPPPSKETIVPIGEIDACPTREPRVVKVPCREGEGEGEGEGKELETQESLLSSDDDTSDPKKANGKESDLSKAFDNWNTVATELGLPVCRKLSADRARKLKVRLHEHGIKGWNEALRNLYSLPFCLGHNTTGWKADFDFLLQPKSFNKVLEMAYAQAEGDKH